MPAKTIENTPTNPEGTKRPSAIRRVSHKLLRSAINLLALAMLFEIVLVVTPVTDKLFAWLVVTGPPESADLIVCLGGRHERLLWAAKTFNQGFAPKIVVSNAQGASQEMKRLLTYCGVPPDKIIVDAHSHTTAEHPAGLAALPGVDPAKSRLLIITDHEHSRRVAACFRRGGF